jgi:ABC-type polysaccharide/polyol phosphate transport system ATPase subunit
MTATASPATRPEPKDLAIALDKVWVTFKTTRERKKPSLARTLQGMRDPAKRSVWVEALRGVTLDIQRGSVYGVIGHNGAGKTTLFRAIAGILPPSHGRITVWGRVTPLLSLGVGFNRDLTGRENILLGGLTFGLSADEVQAHFHEVEAFAGLGQAIDFPMRTYSSGMFSRLAFSVAAHLQPEILLVDEALAAGDAAFKVKSMDKIVELCSRDCTVLIVSHGLEVVKSLADRCVWLEQGRVRMEAPADQVVTEFLTRQRVDRSNVVALEDV